MLGGTHRLGDKGFGSGFDHAFLGHADHVERTLVLGVQVVAVIGISHQEGAVRLHCLFAHAGVEHTCSHRLDVVGQQVFYRSLVFTRHGIVLEHQLHGAGLLLLVLVNDNDGFLVVGNGLVNHLGGVGVEFAVLEQFLDLCLDVIDIHVTHDDQGLVVGTIPLVVIVAQFLIGETVHHAHQADGHAAAILRIGIQCLELAFHHALIGAAAQSPLLVDDTALLVDFLVGEQQAVAPVLENEQTRVNGALARAGHVVDVIHGLGDAGVGIQVAAELHTQ